MNVVFVSAFRNMSGRIAGYLDQVKTLQDSHSVRVVAVEGDSLDRTAEELVRLSDATGVRLSVHTHNHGQRVFGSTEDADRLEALTGVMITGMGAVTSSDDVVVYIESDLRWDSTQILNLIKIVERGEVDVVAPLVLHNATFYDVFVFRKNGRRFAHRLPYHPELSPTGITEVDSAGSCLVMRSEIARRVRPDGKLGLISWCKGARAAGFLVGVAAELKVTHP